jgi:hypothetical protein
VAPFFKRQPEYEIFGKALSVSLHGLIEYFRRHPIEFGQVSVEQDLVVTDDINTAFNEADAISAAVDTRGGGLGTSVLRHIFLLACSLLNDNVLYHSYCME